MKRLTRISKSYEEVSSSLSAFLISFILLFLFIPTNAADRQLVWSDEFNDGQINTGFWNFETGTTNDNIHFYTAREENARITDGKLQIIALKEAYNGLQYTSALIQTKNKIGFRYGRIEARIKLPGTKGFVPAFWLLPEDNLYGWWPNSGEIDIMEHPTHEPENIYGTIHTQSYNYFTGTTPKGDVIEVSDSESAFHVYAVEWDENSIKFFVDNSQYFTYTKTSDYPSVWPFDKPFYIILNLAVGGGWSGNPDESTVFPAIMEVDYVRLYQSVDEFKITGPDFVLQSSDESEYWAPLFSESTYEWLIPAENASILWQDMNRIGIDWNDAGGDIGLKITRGDQTYEYTYPVVVSDNMIKNPGFEKGVKYWEKVSYPNSSAFETDNSDVSKSGNTIRVDVNSLGINTWDIQLIQTGFSLEKGKRYEGSFQAKANDGMKISLAIINPVNYTLYFSKTYNITTSWSEYTFAFTPSVNTDAQMNIDLGHETGTLFMDEFNLYKVEDVTSHNNLRKVKEEIIKKWSINPVTGAIEMDYFLKHITDVKVSVFNLNGQIVNELYQKNKNPGAHKISLEKNAFNQHRTSEGMYIIKVITEWGTDEIRIVVI